MKVLVTGGAGFIGHNAAIYLKNQGYDTFALDNLKRATGFAVERLSMHHVPLVKGDILSLKALRNVLDSVDVVVHAAAYISVEESIKKPALYFRNNVAGTANIANACLRRGVKLIYISSAAVYGTPVHLPINESHPANPISPYGLAKLMGEEAVKFYARQGLKYAILRLFNVYGPGQSSAYAGVITRFIERLSVNKPPIIYGDGQQTRDFIHVYDVAEAIKLTMENNVENETLNIAAGTPVTINELAEHVTKLAGLSLKPVFAKPRPGDIKHSHADTSKARRLLGFTPKISLEQGLKMLLKSGEKRRVQG
ncbi:MAG: NAD-dependent epimerase/dehydratase family protein [Nitrososphaerota archaeon]|nr:NAD-dependent epimerase/dehydratase family protein [Candidatus Bathyarchaeota archaeon]MDW8194098.1 NAD-dependent epimerase/dehydratase family protein [Nitrososphaerota archaeon]